MCCFKCYRLRYFDTDNSFHNDIEQITKISIFKYEFVFFNNLNFHNFKSVNKWFLSIFLFKILKEFKGLKIADEIYKIFDLVIKKKAYAINWLPIRSFLLLTPLGLLRTSVTISNIENFIYCDQFGTLLSYFWVL